MSNYYPIQLRSFVNKLHGYSQTTAKLSTLSGALSAGPRQTVVVSFPPNSLILPESFTMWARAQTSGAMQVLNPTSLVKLWQRQPQSAVLWFSCPITQSR
jgi:hypothetical protein